MLPARSKSLTSLLWLIISFLLLFTPDTLVLAASTSLRHTVYWNVSNPLFSTASRREPAELTVRLGDELEMLCPNDGHTVLAVYQVDEMGFLSCVRPSHALPVLLCDVPTQPLAWKTTIRSASPLPHALVFEPSHQYYFIVTSTGTRSGLHRTQRGLCQTASMRLALHIAAPPNPTTSTSSSDIGSMLAAPLRSGAPEPSSTPLIPPHQLSGFNGEQLRYVIGLIGDGFEGSVRFAPTEPAPTQQPAAAASRPYRILPSSSPSFHHPDETPSPPLIDFIVGEDDNAASFVALPMVLLLLSIGLL